MTLQMMFLKYQLPSEPNVYVDLLDDEDVSLMFDEVQIQLHVMRSAMLHACACMQGNAEICLHEHCNSCMGATCMHEHTCCPLCLPACTCMDVMSGSTLHACAGMCNAWHHAACILVLSGMSQRPYRKPLELRKDCRHIVQLKSQPWVPYAHTLIWLAVGGFCCSAQGDIIQAACVCGLGKGADWRH